MNIHSERSQTVDRALMILSLFTNQKSLWGVTELSTELGLSKSVVHRLLASLQLHGFVEKDPDTEKYQLGVMVFVLGKVAVNQMTINKVALPIMKELADISGESIILTIRDGMNGVASEVVEGPQAITWKTSLGNRLPLHCGASKKVILAFQSREFIANYLKTEKLVRISDQKLADPATILEELDQIRREGFALTIDEVDLGVTGIAAPIYDHNGCVIAGLTIGGPGFRFTDRLNDLTLLIKRAAADISQRLGYLPRVMESEIS